MEPGCPKEEDPGSQGRAAKLSPEWGRPGTTEATQMNVCVRACVHTAAMEVPRVQSFSTGRTAAPRRWRNGEAVPGSEAARTRDPGETEESQWNWEGVPAGLGEAA